MVEPRRHSCLLVGRGDSQGGALAVGTVVRSHTAPRASHKPKLVIEARYRVVSLVRGALQAGAQPSVADDQGSNPSDGAVLKSC